MGLDNYLKAIDTDTILMNMTQLFSKIKHNGTKSKMRTYF